MNRSHILSKAALAITFVGVLLVSYPAARPVPKDQAQFGAQVVAQGTTNGVVACARCHGFDGAADGSGAFPKLAGQSPQYLAQELRAYASAGRQNALMQSIAKGLSAGEIDAVAQYYASIPTISLPSRPQSAQLIARGERLAKVGDIAVRIQACEILPVVGERRTVGDEDFGQPVRTAVRDEPGQSCSSERTDFARSRRACSFAQRNGGAAGRNLWTGSFFSSAQISRGRSNAR